MKIISSSFLVLSLFAFYSCTKNLNQSPAYGLNSEVVYSDPNNYINVLSKLYSGLSMTGLQGPAGQADIAGIDEGFSAYVRVLWNLQELPTDEAVCGWNDPGIPTLNKMQWNADDGWVKGMYYRIYYQITLCNEFIYQSRDERLDERGFSDADKEMIRMYRNEARFLRSLSYFHAMDLFGNVPFVTEEDRVGAFQPERITRTDLFNYVESELIDLSNVLSAAGTVDYGRATREAAKTLLAKVYLNAEVYSGTNRYDDCRNYCEQVINSGAFQLDMDYQHLFLADNQNSSEVIFPVVTMDVCTNLGWNDLSGLWSFGWLDSTADYGVNSKWEVFALHLLSINSPILPKILDFYSMRWTELEITNLGTFTRLYFQNIKT